MSPKTASDFDQELLNLFDRYVHGLIDRRQFLDGAGKFAAGGLTAAALLEALSPRFAEAQQVPRDDKRLHTETVAFDSPAGTGKAKGYLARPAGKNSRGGAGGSAAGAPSREGLGTLPGFPSQKLPAVLVVHENRGLNPHIEDVARRMALEGFVAFAPDALAPLGGYPGDEDKARALFQQLDQTKTREDFVAAVAWLKKRPDVTGKIGAVGFCYGGGIANLLATRVPDLGGAVPFYGSQPKAEDVPRIKAPLLIHYAENDDRINAGIAAYEEALKANKVKYQLFKYPGTQHGFNNDTTPRYDKAAAAQAWQRTVEFFKKNLA